MTITDLQAGQKGRITGLSSADSKLRRQMLTMGLTPGAVVEFVRVAPLGDPIELKIRGFKMSLRNMEASAIEVEKFA